MIQPSTTVGDLTTSIPHATRVFARYQIDFCCGAKRSLVDACASANAPLDEVISSLEIGDRAPPSGAARLADAPLPDVVTYLLERHHAFTKSELDRLSQLAEKVARVHGERLPRLLPLRDLVYSLRDDLMPHMMKEEHILFPFVVAMASGRSASAPFGSIEGPIGVMNADHVATGDLLREIRAQADEFVAPADACGSFRALYEGLRELEQDIHEHIALEESVLFPRALGLASRR